MHLLKDFGFLTTNPHSQFFTELSHLHTKFCAYYIIKKNSPVVIYFSSLSQQGVIAEC